MLFAARNQMNVFAPGSLAGRTGVRVEVRRTGFAPATVTIPVLGIAPAVFTISGNGQGPAIAIDRTGRLNSEENPALAGESVTIFATGLGEFTRNWPDSEPAPRDADLRARPKVFVDGVEAEVLEARAVPRLMGRIGGVRFTVPAGTAPGIRSVRVTSGQESSRSTVYLWTR